MYQICSENLCTDLKLFCTCNPEVFYCLNHINDHINYECKGEVQEICKIWLSKKKYFKSSFTYGMSIAKVIKIIEEKYDLNKVIAVNKKNISGKTLKKKFLKGIITFIPKILIVHATKVEFYYQNQRFSKKFELYRTFYDLFQESCEFFQIFPDMFLLDPFYSLDTQILETEERKFFLRLKPFDLALNFAYNYLMNFENTFNPIKVLFENAKDISQSLILTKILHQMSEMECEDLKKLNSFQRLLQLECLKSSDFELSPEVKEFKNAIFDGLFRPLNFRKIVNKNTIGNDSDKEYFIRKSIAYSESLLLSVNLLENGFGTIEPYKLSLQLVNLASSILLSKPSLQVMQKMHSSQFFNYQSIKDYAIKVINSWKKGKNVYI